MPIDDFDARLLTLLTEEPRIGVFEASRRLGVARGTVQARLDKLQRSGTVVDFAPTVDTVALGYPVMAFVTAEIAQGQRNTTVIDHLRRVPEVLETHTITGQGDLLIRVVAASNADLQRVIDELVGDPNIVRTSTVVVLDTQMAYRTLPLVWAAAGVRRP
ncbi:MAG: transcriptional regulator, AsnC family [Naasia sp.]|nr:transcriptional regulator, AsnC family [Naasia sp.]